MSEITKKDIEEIVHKPNDELARMIQAGFLEMNDKFKKIDERFEKIDERFEKIDERFEKIDERFEKIDERFNKVDDDIKYIHGWIEVVERKMDEGFKKVDAHFKVLEKDIKDIKEQLGNIVYRHEFENLRTRIEVIEKKISIA